MNYIELINDFWKLHTEEQFSPVESVMYFHLLDVSNRLGWKNPFKQANSRIASAIGVTEKTIQAARKHLEAAGLVRYQHGDGRRYVSTYTLIRLIEKVEKNNPLVLVETAIDSRKVEKNNPLLNNQSKKDTKKGAQKVEKKEAFTTINIRHKQNKTRKENTYPLRDTPESNLNPILDNPEKSILRLENTSVDTQPIQQGKKTVTIGRQAKTVDFEAIINMYHEECPSFNRIVKISDTRKAKIKTRLDEMPEGIETLQAVFEKMEALDFCKGENRQGWKASFDWLMENDKNWLKVIEGNYDNKIHTDQSKYQYDPNNNIGRGYHPDDPNIFHGLERDDKPKRRNEATSWNELAEIIYTSFAED